ncbi:inositol monophosphatase family protein [Streptomyces albus]|uniref:inositol monophosphatase family protein n=1 Tax=Streptomyces sp. PHES57 TaxID=2872626 RepID=UPI001CED008F|nr:inositol monophosphatase family protein [Streptomyces sp. PHES57]
MPVPSTAGVDEHLLGQVSEVVEEAGAVLLGRRTAYARGTGLDELVAEVEANDRAVLDVMKAPLLELRPEARWAEDELAGGALPDGEWWVADPAEGNINHVHGMPEWAVTATLVHDNVPVLTATHLPLAGELYTALAGGGAHLDGEPLRVSAKTDLGAAITGTAQARPGESETALRTIGDSVTAMMTAGLLVRVSVPATLHLLNVAAGRMDAFFQFSDVRADKVAGALLVAEAGGTVTDLRGRPWTAASPDFLAAAPGIHEQARRVLAPLA